MAAKNEKWQIDRGYKKSRCNVLSYISDNHHSHSHSDMEQWEQGWRPVSDLHSLLEENIDNNGRSSLHNDVIMAWLMTNDQWWLQQWYWRQRWHWRWHPWWTSWGNWRRQAEASLSVPLKSFLKKVPLRSFLKSASFSESLRRQNLLDTNGAVYNDKSQ